MLVVEGKISKISENQNGEKVLVLKEEGVKAGVSATFSKKDAPWPVAVKPGDVIKIKGAITAGSSYDADLDLYEHAVLVQCVIVRD